MATEGTSSQGDHSSWISKIWNRENKVELLELAKLTWPIVLAQMSMFVGNAVTLVFSGHLGELQLDAVSLAITLILTFGMTTVSGIANACDTLFSQTYGSEHKEYTGVQLQKGIIIAILASMLICSIFVNAEHLLLALGQNPDISRLTGSYILIFSAGMPAYAITAVISRYQQCQSVVTPSWTISLATLMLNVAFHFVFVTYMQLDVNGAAIALTLACWCQTILMVVHTVCSKMFIHTWNGWSAQCLIDWKTVISLAIPSFVMVFLESMSIEMLTILSGLMGKVELGAFAVSSQVANIMVMIPIGMGVATAVRVGNHLGAGLTSNAERAAKVALFAGGCVALVNSVIVATFTKYIPYIFTNVRKVAELLTSLLLIVCACHLFDFGQSICSGILRGSGQQKIGAFLTIISFLCVGLPTSAALMFATNIGVYGTWIGIGIGLVTLCISYVVVISRNDWDKLTQNAISRTSGKEHKVTTNKKDFSLNEYGIIEESPTPHSDSDLLISPKHTGYNTNVLPNAKNLNAEPVTLMIVLSRVIALFSCVTILVISLSVKFFLDSNLQSGYLVSDYNDTISIPNATVQFK